MHLHFERTVNARSDCSILSLTWMGKVPDELPEDEGWKLNRTNYYQEGWLATGNIRGIVGVTFTTSHCKKNVDFPLRTNYNLRGHRSDVVLVKWNEPYQKLASCDSSGIIFVWIKYEGRWSIELINDRNTAVTHFSWSHDGRMALICYQDGFVLVGSVAGQRYWSSMLNLEATITCGIWTPDDQQVYFGTTSGQIIVMDVHGAMVSQVQLGSDVGILSMAWSCEKFKMEEGDDNDPGVTNAAERSFVLAVCMQNGYIYLLRTFDDVSPVQIDTELTGNLCLEWSNSRELLAVAGTIFDNKSGVNQSEYINILKFYNERGILLYATLIPFCQAPVSALTWGHNDKRLFLATGTQIHIAWISRRIATLQLLSRLKIYDSIECESQLQKLPLPVRIRNLIGNLFVQTIRVLPKCFVPEISSLREFVSRPPLGSVRLHCTMIKHDEDNSLSSGTCYTLYLEYLGGLVPLLKGKRTSKIRPEFVIFDPQVEDFNLHVQLSRDYKSSSSSQSTSGGGLESDSSDSDRGDGCAGSPRMQRRRKRRNKSQSRTLQAEVHRGQIPAELDVEDLSYVDTLPEHVRLVEVTSNIWGTKFKMHGVANSVPANLGQITYKTSLLHLQPRQMTLVITELRDDFPVGPDPNFNPNVFSEDEDDLNQDDHSRFRSTIDSCPPIAPMSPRNRLPKPKTQLLHHLTSETKAHGSCTSTKRDNYDEEFPYVELTEALNYCESIRPHSHITAHSSVKNGTGTQSTSFVGSVSRNSSLNSTSQRHAISPLCCEVSVPALQSPKNAVAPSDIIFDRPPAQTLISYSTNDYLNSPANLHQIKTMSNEQGKSRIMNINLNSEQSQASVKKEYDNADNLNKAWKGNLRGSINASANCNILNNINDNVKRKEANSFTKGCTDYPDSELKFIDESSILDTPGPSTSNLLRKSQVLTESMVRSCSVGYLDLVDAQLVPSDIALLMLRKDTPKRLVLVNNNKQKRQSRPSNRQFQIKNAKNNNPKSPKLKNCVKSRSLDSSDIFPTRELDGIKSKPTQAIIPEIIQTNSGTDSITLDLTVNANETSNVTYYNNNENHKSNRTDNQLSPLKRMKQDDIQNSNIRNIKNACTKKEKNMNSRRTSAHTSAENPSSRPTLHSQALATLENLLTKLKEDDRKSRSPSPRMPRSSPSSPAPSKKGKRPQSASPIRKHLLNSPLLGRRIKKNKNLESSDDEVTGPGDDIFCGKNYRDLETFQKAQLRQKLKRGKIVPNGSSCNNYSTYQRREFVMHNKAPMWNENSQVYQLDFGGRVTQESAKNFQIEFRGKQVMQFGRIDGNAYTLDFQYPFSALQAFSVALANVTQRLK